MMIKLPPHAAFCLERLEARGYRAHIVGGCVRDSLRGLCPADWDICTNARPEETAACFADCKTIPTGEKHGTVTVLAQGVPVEITTYRSDGAYTDHRHPEQVSFSNSLESDLLRRDFTVNAMAWNPRGGLVDLSGGAADLEAGVIRCVGVPAQRFGEDALRILRMFRFSARLEYTIEPQTFDAAKGCAHLLAYISRERVFSELCGILTAPQPGITLAAMCRAGVLQEILPEFAPCIGFDQHTPYHDRTVDAHTFAAVDASPPRLPVRLALLLHDIAKPACFRVDKQGKGHFFDHQKKGAVMAREILRRLRCDRATLELVSALIALHDEKLPATAPELKRMLSFRGEMLTTFLLEVRIADNRAKNPMYTKARLEYLLGAKTVLEGLLREKPPFRIADLAVNGSDLLALGFPEGPRIGETLLRLLELVIEDEARNERAFLLGEARRLLDEIL